MYLSSHVCRYKNAFAAVLPKNKKQKKNNVTMYSITTVESFNNLIVVKNIVLRNDKWLSTCTHLFYHSVRFNTNPTSLSVPLHALTGRSTV